MSQKKHLVMPTHGISIERSFHESASYLVEGYKDLPDQVLCQMRVYLTREIPAQPSVQELYGFSPMPEHFANCWHRRCAVGFSTRSA